METSSPPTKATGPWKSIAVTSFYIVCFYSGLAFVLAATLVGAYFYRQESRPTLPAPWNTSALVATASPTYASNDGKSLELSYTVKNNTVLNYSQDDEAAKKLRLMIKNQDGELSPPFENKELKLLSTPIFIPAGQTGALSLSIEDSDLPTPKDREVKADYDERVRTYLETEYTRFTGFALYDDVNRYQINLPKWAEEKPAN